MSRGYRRDEGGYGDDDGGGTWDRGRFERARARSRGPYGRGGEYDTVNVEEDRYTSRGDGPVQEKIRVSVNDDRIRGPPPREYERRRYVEEERFSPPQRQRPEFLDEGRYAPAGREIQQYRREYDDYDLPARRPARPSYARRQSSLDTYDRRPVGRYDDRGRNIEERDVNVSINVQAPPPPPAVRRQEPQPRYRDYEYKVKEPEPELHIRREREVIRETSRGREIEDDYVDIEVPAPEPRRKRGKTRMPKRLVHKAALNRLGYPYEEEDNVYIVLYALQKEEIDEVIKFSEIFFDDNKTIFHYEETKETRLIGGPEAPLPPPPLEDIEIRETVTRKIIENPTPSDFGEGIPSSSSSASSEPSRPAKSVKSARSSKSKARSGHSRSRRGGRVESEEDEEEAFVKSRALVLPERSKPRNPRDINAQINALEKEKRALKLEREAKERLDRADRLREEEYEILENPRRQESGGDRSVRIEKDKRGRLALVRSAQ